MEKHKLQLVTIPLLGGLAGAVLLFGLYFVILTWLNSTAHAWQQYLLLWPWMTLLVVGFGAQVGLFIYLRGYKKVALATGTGTGAIVATGGVSTGSMVACCLHHAVEVLPILGLSAAAIFLSRYQVFFLGIGVVSNLVGITFMLHIIQKHKLFLEQGVMNKIMKGNMQKIMYSTLVLGGAGLLLLLAYFLWF